MKSTLEKDSGTGVSPVRFGSHRQDARGTKVRGKKRGSLLMTKEFWRALSSASLPHAPTLRRLHD
jgi:hypothetical protein